MCALVNQFLRWIGEDDRVKAYMILERFRDASEIVCKAVPCMRRQLTVLETHMFLDSTELAKSLWPEIEFELLERWADSDGENIWLRDDDTTNNTSGIEETVDDEPLEWEKAKAALRRMPRKSFLADEIKAAKFGLTWQDAIQIGDAFPKKTEYSDGSDSVRKAVEAINTAWIASKVRCHIKRDESNPAKPYKVFWHKKLT